MPPQARHQCCREEEAEEKDQQERAKDKLPEKWFSLKMISQTRMLEGPGGRTRAVTPLEAMGVGRRSQVAVALLSQC